MLNSKLTERLSLEIMKVTKKSNFEHLISQENLKKLRDREADPGRENSLSKGMRVQNIMVCMSVEVRRD